MIYLYALLSGGCAVLLESVFRSYPELGYWKLLPLVVPVEIVLGWGVWKIFTMAPYLLAGAVVFSFGTATMRVLSSYVFLNETPDLKTWLAFSLILGAQSVKFFPVGGD